MRGFSHVQGVPMHLRHSWYIAESIGFVVTYRCWGCSKTKTRLKLIRG